MNILMCDAYHDDLTYGGVRGVCWGTKEQEHCTCDGNPLRCDFYPEIIEKTKDKYDICCETCKRCGEEYDDWCMEHCKSGVSFSSPNHENLPLMWEEAPEENNNTIEENQELHSTTQSPSMVNHPQHYNQGGIECIDAANAMVSSYPDPIDASLSWQVIKYLWRHPFKAKPTEDLEKCKWYLERLIEYYQKGLDKE